MLASDPADWKTYVQLCTDGTGCYVLHCCQHCPVAIQPCSSKVLSRKNVLIPSKSTSSLVLNLDYKYKQTPSVAADTSTIVSFTHTQTLHLDEY